MNGGRDRKKFKKDWLNVFMRVIEWSWPDKKGVYLCTHMLREDASIKGEKREERTLQNNAETKP